VLDEIGMDTQHFIADGSRSGAKTVPSDGWKTREKARSYAGFGIFLELLGYLNGGGGDNHIALQINSLFS